MSVLTTVVVKEIIVEFGLNPDTLVNQKLVPKTNSFDPNMKITDAVGVLFILSLSEKSFILD